MKIILILNSPGVTNDLGHNFKTTSLLKASLKSNCRMRTGAVPSASPAWYTADDHWSAECVCPSTESSSCWLSPSGLYLPAIKLESSVTETQTSVKDQLQGKLLITSPPGYRHSLSFRSLSFSAYVCMLWVKQGDIDLAGDKHLTEPKGWHSLSAPVTPLTSPGGCPRTPFEKTRWTSGRMSGCV